MNGSDKKRDEPEEESLDPGDWQNFRSLAHQLLDSCIDRLANARDLPWRPPDGWMALHAQPAPRQGRQLDEVVRVLIHDILPFSTGNTHPRFFGWVHGTGLASALLAEMISATMNSNCGGRDHAAVYIERLVIEWCKEVFGFPREAGGILTGGTSMATVLALSAARARLLGNDVRRRGMRGQRELVVYAVASAHNCVDKALELMGIGSNALRHIPACGNAGAMDLAALERAVAQDRAAGCAPLCVVGTAGSVDCGAFDSLSDQARFCRDEGIWFHVDGAFGAWLVLAEDRWARLAAGVELADSIAFDFHKWMYVQYDAGGVIVRDEKDLRAAFAGRPSYLQGEEAGLAGGDPWYCDYGVDLSRGFRALKVWTALEAHGLDSFGRKISDNCRQAAEMGRLVELAAGLALAAPVVSNICCFRVVADELSIEQLNALHRRIATRLQLAGDAVLSTTSIDGRTALRAAIVNHRTRMADIRLTVDAVSRCVEEMRRCADPSTPAPRD